MQAQAACDVRNARYNRRLQAVVDEQDSASSSISSTSSLPDRLNQVRLLLHRITAKQMASVHSLLPLHQM
jgi:hypothetical protein